MIGALQQRFSVPAKPGTDQKINMRILNDMAIDNTYYTLYAQQLHSLPQALSGKRARASLSGHSSLVALYSLACSQRGQ